MASYIWFQCFIATCICFYMLFRVQSHVEMLREKIFQNWGCRTVKLFTDVQSVFALSLIEPIIVGELWIFQLFAVC